MTRTYARQEVRYDRVLIDHLVEEGMAQYFPGLPGYVVKTDEGSYAVRNHQIVDAGPQPVIEVKVEEPDFSMGSYDAAWLIEKDRIEAEDRARIAPDSADEDALLAKFGV